MDETPIAGADLDRWARRFGGSDVAALALLSAGTVDDLDELVVVTGLAGDPTKRDFVRWSMESSRFRELESQARAPGWSRANVARIIGRFRAQAPIDRPFIRLAIGGDAVPVDVVPRLLTNVGVDSAIIPAERPPGALKRREWSWPLRIGFAGWDVGTMRRAITARRDCPPRTQLDIRDITVEPEAIDVLVVSGPLTAAVNRVRASRQVANAVIVTDIPPAFWPVADSQLALLRAATGAVAAVVADVGFENPKSQLAGALCTLIRRMSIGQPFDVAVTAAFGPSALIAGETTALRDYADLGAIVRTVTSGLRQTLDWYPPAVGVTSLQSRLQELEPSMQPKDIGFAAGDLAVFDEFETPPLRDVRDELESALPTPLPRYLQCVIRPQGPRRVENQIHYGANEVDIFVGPTETTLVAGPVSDNDLEFDTGDSQSARVSVILVPLTPRGAPIRTQLDVPRMGRSANATLVWNVPRRGKRASARIMLVHRNRVLQTAVLSGTIGQYAQLKQLVVLRNDFVNLDDRRTFDAVIVKNTDEAGRHAVMIVRDGQDSVTNSPELIKIGEQIGNQLVEAAGWHGKSAAAKRNRHTALINLAVTGYDLWSQLIFEAPDLKDARYVQILTVHSPRALPLELAYTRVPPAEDAVLCPSWSLGGQGCGAGCGTDEYDDTIVCPAAFWGLSRVLERHYAPSRRDGGVVSAQTRDPLAKARRLAVDCALVAASAKVSTKDLAESVRILAEGTEEADSWIDWTTKVAAAPARNLLVLMPHNKPGPALEIRGALLKRGYLRDRHVVGNNGDLSQPVVLLFGCDTAGSTADPAGWAGRFVQRKAAVVFSTLTMLYAGDAAKLAQLMSTLLRTPGRSEQSIGELAREFRAKALHDDVISALGVASYGDTDWTV